MVSLAEEWKEEVIEIGIQNGIKIDKAIGGAKSKVEIAKKLLSKNYTISDISDLVPNLS